MTKRKGSKVELFQLEQFQAIAEFGTMREAAEKLYLTQPTLSRNLKNSNRSSVVNFSRAFTTN